MSVAEPVGISQSNMEDKTHLRGVDNLIQNQEPTTFERDVGQIAAKRFQAVQQKIQKLLVDQTRSTRQNNSDPAPITKLLVLGEDSSDSAPKLVVFCSPKRRKRIRRLLNSSLVQRLCEPSHGGIPRLEVEIINYLPQMKFIEEEVDIGFNSANAIATDETTFLGALKSSINNAAGSSRGRKRKGVGKRKATTGNVIDKAWVQYEQRSMFEDLEDKDLDKLSPRSAICEEGTSTKKPENFASLASSTTALLPKCDSNQNLKFSVEPSASGLFLPLNATSDGFGSRTAPYYSGLYSKRWEPLFSTDRKFKERDESWVQQKRIIDAEGDDFEIFFTDFEDSVPSCESEEVQAFCKGAHLRGLESSADISGQQRGAWLDDRIRPAAESSQCVREYKNPLKPTDLYKFLNTPVGSILLAQ
jgi:hypothetical protein